MLLAFDNLHFTESLLSEPVLKARDLEIIVSQVLVLGRDPRPYAGRLRFRDVAFSVREITEYIGDPKAPRGFKETYVVHDVDSTCDAGLTEYGIEGIQLEPFAAWIDWTIRAASVELNLQA